MKRSVFSPIKSPHTGSKEGKRSVTVSVFGIIETVDALKRRITKDYVHNSEGEYTDKIESIIKQKISMFSSMIYELEIQRKIVIIDEKTDTFHVYPDVLNAAKSDLGPIKHLGKSRGYMYMGLGFADYMHAYIARAAGVTDFYTTDAAFGALNGDPRFEGMRFHVLKSGRAQGSP